MQIGNEPWDYPAAFYNTLLNGFSQGCKAGDSALQVLPCALQADTTEAASSTSGNYIGARVLQADAQYLDALNIHAYSFYTRTEDGRNGATYPEDPRSYMHAVRNLIRWRDVNTPTLPVRITEWGWDSDGPVTTCTGDQYWYSCVTEEAQAIYAVRGALLLAREGLESAVW